MPLCGLRPYQTTSLIFGFPFGGATIHGTKELLWLASISRPKICLGVKGMV